MLKALADADKSIAFWPGWSKPDADDGYTHFQAPLAIGSVAEAGLFLTGGAYAGAPDKHVTFEIVLLTAGGHRSTKLMRIDWRSLRGGHTNQRRHACLGCARRTAATHFHAFDINFVEATGRMRGPKLPCARDIPEGLQSFEELRAYVGKHFKINAIEVVGPPEWAYILVL
jgi:hypothetical protein